MATYADNFGYKIENIWGTKIWDETGYYFSEIAINQNLKHNRPTGSTLLFNSTYPKHTHNGLPSYYSGSCSANFSDNKSTECISEYNFGEGNVKYVYDFIDWLHNDRIKYLQLSPRLIIPVGILDTVEWSVDQNSTIDDGENIIISFEWEQLEPAIVGRY